MACPACGTGMSYRLGAFICPKCGREVEAPRPGKPEKRWSIRPEPWEQQQYREQVKKAHHEPEDPYGGGAAHQPRATQTLGMYGDSQGRAVKEYEGYGKLMWEKHLYFLYLVALHGFVIYCVAAGRMPENSWFFRFNYGYFLFFLGWVGLLYLFFMWLVIYRQSQGLKWLVISLLTVLILHLLLSYLDDLVGIRYEAVEALNHHVVHLGGSQDTFYLVAIALNLWFISILWRDVRRLRQFD
jgi:uncharacterized Zn finger protein (UPF0148 family)